MNVGDKFKNDYSGQIFEVLKIKRNGKVKVGYNGTETGWTRVGWLNDECTKVPQDNYSKQKRKLKI